MQSRCEEIVGELRTHRSRDRRVRSSDTATRRTTGDSATRFPFASSWKSPLPVRGLNSLGLNLRGIGSCVLAAVLLASGCTGSSKTEPKPDAGAENGASSSLPVLQLPIPSDGPKSMDPIQGSTQYDNICVSQVYETLLQFKYLVRPFAMEPLLLESMPEVSDDGLTYHFKLKPNVHFHDDACFPEGKGRELTSQDVIYSLKRLADDSAGGNRNWWIVRETIQGFDEYREQQNAAEKFNYDAPVSGMKILNDREFEITLVEPIQRFLWTLTMFQTSIVPREAVEKYGNRFGRQPVGTGPYTMKPEDWTPNQSMILAANPNYHECYYPSEHMPEDEDRNLHQSAGQRLPLNGGIVYRFFVEEQPMWLQFRQGDLAYSRVPRDNFSEAFNRRTRKLRSEFVDEGIQDNAVPLLDFIFYGFNMEDELLGGYTDKNRYLRQAISLAIDWDERNNVVYNDTATLYDGMIPPGLDGHPKDGHAQVNFRGPDLQKARELLAKAGYPNGEGLPTIDYYSSLEGPGKQMAELTQRQLKKIGVNINPRLDVFSTFIESINNKKASFFSFAWGSDYPDAENNLALFYGPNESPGSNHFNYKNAEFDALYEKIRAMPSSPERTKIYEQMRDIVTNDAPYIGSLARTRYYLGQPWLLNFKPAESFHNWAKYLAIDDAKRP